ncbi:sulfite exporter TauE/SafE family protein [Kaustia mangrovi]|uniref:Probable membrane transporter protein n=1 Tax=Kaustia mangrovi TaxID=2593653 RepID=A0A7S8C1Y1_9HYPH|nr:sulfite exporter TauE/SafE family protein [Kaustia mangrovi]QPC41868.1 sulfite exporter TauE/SafE family protein [Kaustia mangrovi]
MEAGQIIVVALAYLAAGFVKGASGLGFSTTCLPILVLALGLKDALALVIIPSVVANIFLILSSGHLKETARRFWPLYAAQIPGIVAGLALLAWIDGAVATVVLGLVLGAYAAVALAQPEFRLAPGPERLLRAPVGFATAVINGLTGSQVMPVVPYMLALRLDPKRFVQAVNLSFTLSSLVMAVGLSRIGLFGEHELAVSVAGLVPSYAGIWIGGRMRGRLSPDQFRRFVLTVLGVLGLVLVLRSLI